VQPTGWAGVYREGRDLYTANSRPGERVYGETLRTADGREYRQWDPFRSKLAALLVRGAREPGPWAGARSVLYLGGAHGTTVSHLSDLLPEARLFVVEKSPTSFAPLLALARRRSNIYPILDDAQLPERYSAEIGAVDLVYQDVAQRNQAAILAENVRVALAPGGRAVLMLKVRSVSQRRSVEAIVREARRTLERASLSISEEIALSPFAREHVALVGRR
jgi:fibrillarin-like pre-rRNA processing protein